MGKINSNVLNNFEDYEKLLTMRKNTHGSGIGPMVFEGTSKVWKWHQMDVAHDDALPAVRLVTELRDDHLENFKFKLMASTFKEPVINFDALGPTHRNPPEVPNSIGRANINFKMLSGASVDDLVVNKISLLDDTSKGFDAQLFAGYLRVLRKVSPVVRWSSKEQLANLINSSSN